MNLNQLKLSKSEWESIEIPVSESEIKPKTEVKAEPILLASTTKNLENEIIPSFGEVILHNEPLSIELANLESNQFLLETDTSTLSIETIFKTVAELRNQSINSLQKEQITNFERIFTKWQIG